MGIFQDRDGCPGAVVPCRGATRNNATSRVLITQGPSPEPAAPSFSCLSLSSLLLLFFHLMLLSCFATFPPSLPFSSFHPFPFFLAAVRFHLALSFVVLFIYYILLCISSSLYSYSLPLELLCFSLLPHLSPPTHPPLPPP